MKNFSKIQFGRRNSIEIIKIFFKMQFGRRNKIEIPLNISKGNLDGEIILKFQ
mgnify:CR=1 FL=1